MDKFTSPRAMGSPMKKKTSGNSGSVSLPQHGGEGDSSYKGNKSDMNLSQHGGEGGGSKGKIVGGSDMKLLDCYDHKGYTAPGRELKVESGK